MNTPVHRLTPAFGVAAQRQAGDIAADAGYKLDPVVLRRTPGASS